MVSTEEDEDRRKRMEKCKSGESEIIALLAAGESKKNVEDTLVHFVVELEKARHSEPKQG
ncbi:unnamed protein product [Arabidopsis thaliana]|uniref:Uncharacterized protein n=2 Tax=Arabidopsis thaliana TaxID=3702 RepID=A0A654EA16_ARATH|nr:uncharacterized protein AT1G15085 [Arabidopsis thaliana]ANM58894.1 hypothetical protein AT1G15085 [Arabidopsis thaliana]CAA0206332.1 unnamed protein product [Arabidopsis thaliana]VYS46136.1 unnamed protein product [Arabidopsis thaliana]|eukprot:NP_001321295.1 hypothetical protein AT1G15085 [Arabidopsis thaliana]